jgi:hypothetical protein
LVRALDGGLLASLSGLGASALVAAALFLLWRGIGMGGGDVKLAAAVGAWVGLEKLIWYALSTAMAGGLVALVCYFLARPSARAEVRTNLTLAGPGTSRFRTRSRSPLARPSRSSSRETESPSVSRRISGLGAARRSL